MKPPRLFERLPLLLALAFLLPNASHAADLVVSTDFPNGSGVVQELDQKERRIRLVPTAHKGRGWACWWHVKITGITPGETLTLDVGNDDWSTPTHATYSIDGGKNWLHSDAGKRAGKRIVYRQKVDAPEALFAWGPPFTPADAQELVDRIAKAADGKDGCKAEPFELCKSREGRSTPALALKAGEGLPKPFGIVVTARQHAWESGGSWVGRGFAEFLTSDDEGAKALRRTTIIYFVPIMDIDNVAVGAGGKNQDPHDHNRDWSDKPVFPAVAACQKIIKDLDAAGSFDFFIDLHNPGAKDQSPFFFTGADELHSELCNANRKEFLSIARETITGPLAFKGSARTSGPQYDKLWKSMSGNWVSATCKPHVVAICLETSWNTPASTAQNYLTVGRQLGATIQKYLEKRVK